MELNDLDSDFGRLLESRGIAAGNAASLRAAVEALAEWVVACKATRQTVVVGMSGAQGSGKSTLAALLAWYLRGALGLRVALLSLDDIYLTRAQRQELARSVHPLFATRGVPGTHDVKLGLAILSKLRRTSGVVRLPAFDKATDDRRARQTWATVELPVDVVLFEGWCLGATAQDDRQLEVACNEFEQEHDPDGSWRRAVNRALSGPYAQLFSQLDVLVYLRVPSFEHALRWRTEQEQRLRARTDAGAGLMSDSEVRRFVCYFERLTRHMLRTMPTIADRTVTISDDHRLLVAVPN